MEAAISVLPMSEQDRAIAIPASGGYLVVLADGASGQRHRLVADRLLKRAQSMCLRPGEAELSQLVREG